jgi:hypothetical protein
VPSEPFTDGVVVAVTLELFGTIVFDVNSFESFIARANKPP